MHAMHESWNPRVQRVVEILRNYGDERAFGALQEFLQFYWRTKGTLVLEDKAKQVGCPGMYKNTTLSRFATSTVSFAAPADDLAVQLRRVMAALDVLADELCRREELPRDTAVYYEDLRIGITQEFYIIHVCCWLTIATAKPGHQEAK